MSEISGYFTEWGNRNGGMSAIMGGTGSLWTETPRLTMIGDYYLYAQTPQIWFADVYSQQFGNYGGSGERSFSFDGDGDGNGGSGSYTTYDGGAYYGIMGGVANGDSLTGRFLAIYIDHDKNAGILSSDLSGTMYPGLSMLEVTGDVTRGFKSVVGVDPKDLYDSVYETYGNEGRIYGTFADDAGYIYGDDYGEFGTASIVDYNNMVAQNWGIYAQHIYGEYEGGTAPTWTAMLGGYDAFGATQPYYSHDEGYWIARINDGTMTQNLDGEGFFGGTGTVRGSVNGTFITHFKMGTISGNLDGIYWEDWGGGYWEGLNLGTWIGQALSFVSDFGMRFGGDYYGAIAGGTDSLWQTAPGGITIIGNMGQGDSSPAHTWSSYGPVISHDYTLNMDTTYDGGAY